jgi:hypothetical protein
MSCCDAGEDFLWIGETYRLDIELRDSDTEELIDLLPKARGTIRVSTSEAALVTFGSESGEMTYGDAQHVTLELDSDTTGALSIDGDRLDAWLQIEFYDDGSSPEEVETYPPQQIVIRRSFV